MTLKDFKNLSSNNMTVNTYCLARIFELESDNAWESERWLLGSERPWKTSQNKKFVTASTKLKPNQTTRSKNATIRSGTEVIKMNWGEVRTYPVLCQNRLKRRQTPLKSQNIMVCGCNSVHEIGYFHICGCTMSDTCQLQGMSMPNKFGM